MYLDTEKYTKNPPQETGSEKTISRYCPFKCIKIQKNIQKKPTTRNREGRLTQARICIQIHLMGTSKTHTFLDCLPMLFMFLVKIVQEKT
jgi:hypothetical protein